MQILIFATELMDGPSGALGRLVTGCLEDSTRTRFASGLTPPKKTPPRKPSEVFPTSSRTLSTLWGFSPGRAPRWRLRAQAALQLLDIGGDMEWCDVAEMGDADGVRPSGEAADGGGVGLAGVRVPDVGGEELEDALGGGSLEDEAFER